MVERGPAEPETARMFAVAATAYDRLMGRYLPSLGPVFADAAGITGGMTALDVGCGPGGLTSVLVDRLGRRPGRRDRPVAAVRRACRQRHPGVDVRQGAAEQLPYPDDTLRRGPRLAGGGLHDRRRRPGWPRCGG